MRKVGYQRWLKPWKLLCFLDYFYFEGYSSTFCKHKLLKVMYRWIVLSPICLVVFNFQIVSSPLLINGKQIKHFKFILVTILLVLLYFILVSNSIDTISSRLNKCCSWFIHNFLPLRQTATNFESTTKNVFTLSLN